MKTINLYLEDSQYETLKEIKNKNKWTWVDLAMSVTENNHK